MTLMTDDRLLNLAWHWTQNGRAMLVPAGVVIAGVVALVGIILTLRHERHVKFDELHWTRRAALYERITDQIESLSELLGEYENDPNAEYRNQVFDFEIKMLKTYVSLSLVAPDDVGEAYDAVVKALSKYTDEVCNADDVHVALRDLPSSADRLEDLTTNLALRMRADLRSYK